MAKKKAKRAVPVVEAKYRRGKVNFRRSKRARDPWVLFILDSEGYHEWEGD